MGSSGGGADMTCGDYKLGGSDAWQLEDKSFGKGLVLKFFSFEGYKFG